MRRNVVSVHYVTASAESLAGFSYNCAALGRMRAHRLHDRSTPGQVTFEWLRTDDRDRVVIITKTMPAQMAAATARTLIAELGVAGELPVKTGHADQERTRIENETSFRIGCRPRRDLPS
jgi:hypothetical protein